MNQIVKRLEIIKAAISIKEDEIIDLQVMKLNKLECQDEVLNILKMINKKNYARVIIEIESYLKKFSRVMVYEDLEFQALLVELKELETTLEDISNEKDEYLNSIREFNIEYYLHLGPILNEILKLEEMLMQIKLDKMKAANETFEDGYKELNVEYEELKQDHENFNAEYEEITSEDRVELDVEEKEDLKKLFRKASKLCHPDIVSTEHKEKATEIMKELNNAYSCRDIERVKEILYSLENSSEFRVFSDTVEDKDLLKSKIQNIRSKIEELDQEVQELKKEEAVQIMSEYKDLKIYFKKLKKQFEEECLNLKDLL